MFIAFTTRQKDKPQSSQTHFKIVNVKFNPVHNKLKQYVSGKGYHKPLNKYLIIVEYL